jgi:membrane-bound lytic murein transglycosylase B
LVLLENANEAPTYILGTENFYTLTRYNWSSYYALAVIELGQEIKAARQR